MVDFDDNATLDTSQVRDRRGAGGGRGRSVAVGGGGLGIQIAKVEGNYQGWEEDGDVEEKKPAVSGGCERPYELGFRVAVGVIVGLLGILAVLLLV